MPASRAGTMPRASWPQIGTIARACAIPKATTPTSPVAAPVVITVRRREWLTARPPTLEDRPIATAHMSPGETKNEEGGFLLSRCGLQRRLVSPKRLLREGGSHERSECLAKAGSGGAGRLFLTAAFAVPGEDRSFVFEAQNRAQRAPGEGMRQHFERVPQDEQWAVAERRRHVFHLHPALGPPAEKLDIVRRHMLASNHRRRAGVVRHVLIDDQAAIAEVSRHRCTRIRSRMLDVRPVDEIG